MTSPRVTPKLWPRDILLEKAARNNSVGALVTDAFDADALDIGRAIAMPKPILMAIRFEFCNWLELVNRF